MSLRGRRQTVALLALLALVAASAVAQAGRGKGRLSGKVLDQVGKPVVGAEVKLTFEGGAEFDAVTDNKGAWGVIGLGTGTWTVSIRATGYRPVVQRVLIRQLERNPPVEIRLEQEAVGSGVVQDEASFADLEQGNALFAEGRYEPALAMYEEFLKKNPGAYQVKLNIGDCYREKGEYDKAIEAYEALLEGAEADLARGKAFSAKGLAAIGLCHLRRGHLEEAQGFFVRSIEVAPEDELLPYNVAEIYFSNQDIDRAQKYFEMAAAIKPDWPDPYLKLGYVFLNKAEMGKAVESFEKFLKLEPDSPRAAQVKSFLPSIKK